MSGWGAAVTEPAEMVAAVRAEIFRALGSTRIMCECVFGLRAPQLTDADNLASVPISDAPLGPGWRDVAGDFAAPDTFLSVFAPFVVGILTAAMIHVVAGAIGRVLASLLQVGAGMKPKAVQVEHQRFAESFIDWAYFTLVLIIFARIYYNEPWLWDWIRMMDDVRFVQGRKLVHGRDLVHPDELERTPWTFPRDTQAYYTLEFGNYFVKLIKALLVKKEDRKSDFYTSLIHHIITCELIFTSYRFGIHRVGLLVLLVHNSFDPFLHAAKLWHYAFPAPSKWHIMADINFALCALMFLLSRIMSFPYLIYKLWESTAAAGMNGWWAIYPSEMSSEYIQTIYLVCLMPLHFVWFTQIMRVLIQALQGGTVQGDVREKEVPASPVPSESSAETKKAK